MDLALTLHAALTPPFAPEHDHVHGPLAGAHPFHWTGVPDSQAVPLRTKSVHW